MSVYFPGVFLISNFLSLIYIGACMTLLKTFLHSFKVPFVISIVTWGKFRLGEGEEQ